MAEGLYESLNQAVLAALAEAQAEAGKSRRPDAEAGGVVFRNEDGKYHYSLPPNERSRDDRFQVRVQVPRGSTPVATFHNHPKGPTSHLFSPNDTEVARQLGIPSYIIGHDGVTRRFDPEIHKPVSGRSRGIPRGSSKGEVVDLAAEKVSDLLGTL